MTDLVLFPNCDLHIALHGVLNPGTLNVRVMLRDKDSANPLQFKLDSVTPISSIDFFAPFNAVGTRFQNLPTFDPGTGAITATTPGVYLFQVRLNNRYLVGRLQVHDKILGWWFGNSSITTALDSAIAHAQPSIYASFSADAHTDPVGDITGHGYVTLVPADPSKVVVTPDGRLRGASVGAGSVSGTFMGTTHTLNVNVENYGLARNQLEPVRIHDLTDPAAAHHMLFIAEGFRDTDADRKQFDEIVGKVVEELFTKPRHEPYPLLDASFNIWKAYFPSRQHVVTCGFCVTEFDAGDVLGKGAPIPFNGSVGSASGKYTVQELVQRVGLPASDETRDRATLVALWNTQGLNQFDASKVDDDLIKAWRVQKTTAILEARDTFFGFRLGSRLGDRVSENSVPEVTQPPADNGSPELRAFVKRVYEFFKIEDTRSLLLDPRRHPPQLFADPWSDASPGNAVLSYVGGLHARMPPNAPIGQEWQPDPLEKTFKRSRGLIAVITNDGMIGGSNVSASTMTANTLNSSGLLNFELVVNGAERVMRRKPPERIDTDVDDIINTVAHEFGHSFNLGDEYEDHPDAADDGDLNVDFDHDNVTRLAWIFANGTVKDGKVTFNDTSINPSKIKWLDLMRMRVSEVVLKDAELVDNVVKLTLDKARIGQWVKAKKDNQSVFLLARVLPANGKQLPLTPAPTHFLAGLEIGAVDEALGTVLIANTGLPPIGSPVFKRGAVLFVPRRGPKPAESALVLVADEVRAFLTSTKAPLNDDTDTKKVNKQEDDPKRIPQFMAPCKSYKMIGIYEGAAHYAARYYRPTGLCKMRKKSDAGTGDGEFCHVCKWLIVNRVDPSMHAILDDKYFPEPKGPQPEDPNG